MVELLKTFAFVLLLCVASALPISDYKREKSSADFLAVEIESEVPTSNSYNAGRQKRLSESREFFISL